VQLVGVTEKLNGVTDGAPEKGRWGYTFTGLQLGGGHGKTRRGHKVQRGHNLSDLAQLHHASNPAELLYMQRIYKIKVFFLNKNSQ